MQRAGEMLKEQGRTEARVQMMEEGARQAPRIVIPKGVSVSPGANAGELVLRMPTQGNIEIQWE